MKRPNLIQHYKAKFIIWLCMMTHLLWAICLIFASETAVKVTPIAKAYSLIPSPHLLAACYVWASLSTFVGMLFRGPLPWTFATVAPQQFLVIISAMGCLDAIFSGVYSDGTTVPNGHWHLLADQGPIVLLGIIHTIAVISIYTSNKKDG